MKMQLSVNNQSVDSSGITKDYREAICEYIWNGFEANATEVIVSYATNDIDGIYEIKIADDGTGIVYDNLSETFGAFLASQKNESLIRLKTKANKGKGRFSFASFSNLAIWDTTYDDNGTIKNYTITLTNDNKEELEYNEPQTLNNTSSTGTIVTFYNVHGLSIEDLSKNALEDFILNEFAWYLYLNKNRGIKIILNDQVIDYSKHIDPQFSETIIRTVDEHAFEISLIVWNEKIKEKFKSYYFDSKNAVRGSDTTTFNRNTVGFNHSVYVSSEFFDKWNAVSLFEQSTQISFTNNSDDLKVLKGLRNEIQDFIGQKILKYMSSKADQEIRKMIEVRKTFPKFPDDEYGVLRKSDLVRVTKEIYCAEPRIFHKLKDIQEKSLLSFLNLLLSSEEREKILTVIEEIVQLTSEQRQQFVDILKRTKLENIIDTISFIENRYRKIEILKQIVYNLDKFANERDHIQKIVENNYWLFGEQYHLASADKNMHRALEGYNYILHGAKTATEPLDEESEAERRMDVFLSASRKVENNFGSYIEENIVVELKAPRVILTKKVLRQVEDYMDFIRTNPQFNSQQRCWKFIAVCKEVDTTVKAMYNTFRDRGKPGLVIQNDMYEVYAYTWDDIFTGFDIRHAFMLDKLKYDREALSKEFKTDINPNRETVDELTKLAVNQ